MFDGKRYLTTGINATIDPGIQLFIWNLIAELKGKIQLDYLQVFELSKTIHSGRLVQKIVHSQEIPHYRQEHILCNVDPIDAKLYLIDDGPHSTMLLSAEY